MLGALNATTLAKMSLCTAKSVRQEHRTPFTGCLSDALHIFYEVHNVLQLAPAGVLHNVALANAKLLDITTAYTHQIGAAAEPARPLRWWT